jgi:hypothetical protein
MADDVIASSRSVCYRTSHNVCQRAILLDEIQVDRREILERATKISDGRYSLEKYFGKCDSGTDVQIDAPSVEIFHESAQEFEIPVRRGSKRSAVGVRV